MAAEHPLAAWGGKLTLQRTWPWSRSAGMEPGGHAGGQRRTQQLPWRLLHHSTSPIWNEPTNLLESMREVSWTHLQRVISPGQHGASGRALLTGSPATAGLWGRPSPPPSK